MYRLVIIITLFICAVRTDAVRAQTKNQEAAVFAYNVGFGAITSGIGAMINKPKGMKWHNAFSRGLWQGSIGGVLNYASKKTLHLVYRNQNTWYALPATIINAAGFSIMESAALNKPFLRNWSIDYVFFRFDFSTKSIEDLKIRILPQALYATIDISRYGRPNIETSLLTGSPTFVTDASISSNGFTFDGLSSGRAFVYGNTDPIRNKYHIIAHEMIHYFQYREHQMMNTWLMPVSHLIKSKTIKSIFSNYVFMDVPYFYISYAIEGQKPFPHYYRNFYEFEAERISTNKYVEVK